MGKVSALTGLLLAMLSLNASAQTIWTPYVSNPVVPPNFDPSATSIYGPNVIKDGSTYRLWYTRKCTPDSEKIGYATSSDGIAWTLVDSAALRPAGGSTLFDCDKLGQPCVIKINDTLRMWYWGSGPHIGNIGHAWSTDGQHWTKVRGPGTDSSVYDRTQDGGTSLALVTPCVIKDGDTLRMWYGRGYYSTQLYCRLGYAVSTNGINWTHVSGSGSNGCVLDAGASGQFDEFSVYYPTVVKDGSVYRMWYDGINNIGVECIGYATSNDGINWTRHDGTGANGSTIYNAGTSCVVLDGSTFKMWYSDGSGFSYATAPVNGVAGKPVSDELKPGRPALRISGMTLDYTLPHSGNMRLSLYNTAGQMIRTLSQGYRGAGQYRANWDGRNQDGRKAASGVYMARLTSDGGPVFGKLVIVR